MKLFEKLPEGFSFIHNDESYQLTLLTLSLAFGDNHYPVPSIPINHEASIKYQHHVCKLFLDHCLKEGLVLTNDDYTACIAISPMEKRAELDIDEIASKCKEYLDEDICENQRQVLLRMGEVESVLDDIYKPNDIFIEMFAVVTQMQRRKLGSKLMKALFEECDKQKRDIYLATSTELNYDIYKHFGFEIVKRDYSRELNAVTYILVRKHR